VLLVPRARAQEAVRAEPQVEWSFGGLVFEGEPLLDGTRVVASGREPTGRRALVVLDLASGALIARALLPASLPLEPAFSGERIALRADPARVELYRLRQSRLVLERSFAHERSLSAPVLCGDELYLREGGELARYDLARREATWRAQVPGAFRGTPAVEGQRVYALWYDQSGAGHLAQLARTSGARLGDVVLGAPGADVPGEDEAARLVPSEENLFAELPRPLAADDGRLFRWVRVPLAEGGFHGAVTLHAFRAAPLAIPGGWIAPEEDRQGNARWLCVRREGEGERAIELASAAHHEWLAIASTPASRAGDVLYLGPAAVHHPDFEILWRRPSPPAQRPVPADGRLLVVEEGLLRSLASPARALAPAERAARESVRELERRLAAELARLAGQALRSGDLGLCERLLQEAEARGQSGRSVDVVRADLERLGASPRAPAIDPRRQGSVLAEERALRERLPAGLLRAAETSRDPALARALLRELFAREPEHGPGRALLARWLPPGAGALGDAFPQRDWLDYLDVGAQLPLELVADAAPGSSTSRLAEERERWRPDAVLFRSPRLAVITAGASPGAVARVLEIGELVCDLLEQHFGRASGPAPDRLELVLYPTRAEYLRHSGHDLGGLERVLGWTAGHFDLRENVSRMFLPEQPEQRDARLSGVYAHELTHHWLASRSAFGPPAAAQTQPGFWIAEAIATWAEELVLDPALGTWSAENPRAASLDTLAGAAPTDLIPWPAFLALSCQDFQRLETRPTCRLELAWQLGHQAERSPMQLFYAQGGALAHWLYRAEGGRARELLLRAVESFQRGEPLDLARELGLDADELGRRVQEFAREALSP
jgi:hypothetical protein